MIDAADPSLPAGLVLPAPRARPAAPGWMITFADLLALLLAFFVLLFATSTIDRAEWERRVAPIAGYLGGAKAKPTEPVVARPGAAAHPPAYVEALVQHLAESPALAGARALRRGHATVLTLPAGSPEERAAALGEIGRVIAGLDNRAELVVRFAVRDAWQDNLAAAQTMAAELARLSSGRAVVATARPDLPAGTPARIEIVIADENDRA